MMVKVRESDMTVAGTENPSVPTGPDGGYIICVKWTTDGNGNYFDRTLHFAAYDASGNVGQVFSAPGAVSDCKPIVFNGKVVWYTTDALAPVFYTLDDSGLISIPTKDSRNPSAAPGLFTDVPANHWAIDAIRICSEQDIATGLSDGRFDPDGQVTSAQFIAMLTRTFYNSYVEASKKRAPSNVTWYWANMDAARFTGISTGLSAIDENPMNRYEMAIPLHNILTLNGYTASTAQAVLMRTRISDYKNIPDKYLTAVINCYNCKIISGMSDGSFAGTQTMTRAQACAVIVRMMNLINGNTAA